MWSLCSCTAQSAAGVSSKRTWTRSRPSTITPSDASAASSCQRYLSNAEFYKMTGCRSVALAIKERRLRWLGATSSECHQNVSQRKPSDGHHQGRDNQGAPWPPGGAQQRQNWKRWVSHGARSRQLRRTGSGGAFSLQPCVPLGTKRIS